jgi:hypothetical protein
MILRGVHPGLVITGPLGSVVGIALQDAEKGDLVTIAINGVASGSFAPPATASSPALRHAADECGHCGCPYPESPCHYCGMRTRR